MSNRIRGLKTRIVVLYALIVFLAFSVVYSGVMLVIETNATKSEQQSVLSHEEDIASVQASIVRSKVQRLVSDTLYLMDSYRVSLENHSEFTELEAQWLAFSNRNKIFDQIRFIDVNGDERIRVNYTADGAYLTADDKLQNKKDRYYFTSTVALDGKQIYVSKLDLNVENGEIEQPLKPMIRLCVPCRDADESLLGIVVVNYLADDLLNMIRSVATGSSGSLFILNSDGYWIVNDVDSETEWAFMYDGMEDETFANRFPYAWDTIRAQQQGSIVTENGVFVFSDVFLDSALAVENCQYSLVLGDGNFHIVLYLPVDSASASPFYATWTTELVNILKSNVFVYLLFLVLAVTLGVFIGISRSEKEEILYFSEYDALTGVLNRRAGFQKLGLLYKAAKSAEKTVSVCFLDINGLKDVNDTLGHDAGDELIVSVSGCIRKAVRGNDIVARLGGDEFLIVLWDADESSTAVIWDRILAEFARINETESRAYIVSVSCGIESLSPDSGRSIEEAVNHADEKMYANKREIKKNLRVVRALRETEPADSMKGPMDP